MFANMQKPSQKLKYSLLGDPAQGWKRFLYAAYLPPELDAQGIPFLINPVTMQLFYQKVMRLERALAGKISEALDGQLWPVDHWVILYFCHCYVNAFERVKCLLEKVEPANLQFFAVCSQVSTVAPTSVKMYMSRLIGSLEIMEQIVMILFDCYNVETKFVGKMSGVELANSDGIFKNAIRAAKYTLNYYKNLLRYCFIAKSGKKTLLVLNRILSPEDLGSCKEIAEVMYLDDWVRLQELNLPSKMKVLRDKKTGWRLRLKQRLGEIRFAADDLLFKKVISVLVDNYPVALLEGREYFQAEGEKLLKSMGLINGRLGSPYLSVDHGIWKRETFSAVSAAVVKHGGKVIGTAHGSPDGFVNYATSHVVDQCLVTHFLSHFNAPFVEIEKNSPRVYQADLLDKFSPSKGKKLAEGLLSIWYFPHWHVIDPLFYFGFNGWVHPECFFENQKVALLGLNSIAQDPRVKEVVIKLRPDVNAATKQKFFELVDKILGKEKSPKFRLISHLTSARAFSSASIAVHDMFGSGFVESMWANIPSLAVLPQIAEIPGRLPDKDYWIKAGVFVRTETELYAKLLAWVEGNVPDNYEQMRQRFLAVCGLGAPTAGQVLKSIIKGVINNCEY